MLNIRTFDELQSDLSKRHQYEDFIKLKGRCENINEDESTFTEPLNLLNKFLETNNVDFLSFKVVTERQLVTDVLLLL